MQYIPAGKFKAECLKIMDEVNRTGHKFIITKRNVPIAELVPLEKKKSLFGCMKGSVTYLGDILEPIGEQWDADR